MERYDCDMGSENRFFWRVSDGVDGVLEPLLHALGNIKKHACIGATKGAGDL